MAKEKLFKAKALVNLKYDQEVKKIGDELGVRKDDAKEMFERGYIELLEELPKEEEKSNDTGEAKEGE